MRGQLANETVDDVPPARLHLVTLGDDLRVFLGGVLVESLVLTLVEDDTLEEGTHLVTREIVGELTHLVQQIDVLIQHQRQLGFQDSIDKEIDVGFLEDMRDLLEQLVQGYPALIVPLLRNFVESLEVSHLQNGLVDEVTEEVLGFLDQLHVAVGQVDLLEQPLALYPALLNSRTRTIALLRSEE
jgi:hypothetical protein